jgi:hypothetical protein
MFRGMAVDQEEALHKMKEAAISKVVADIAKIFKREDIKLDPSWLNLLGPKRED